MDEQNSKSCHTCIALEAFAAKSTQVSQGLIWMLSLLVTFEGLGTFECQLTTVYGTSKGLDGWVDNHMIFQAALLGKTTRAMRTLFVSESFKLSLCYLPQKASLTWLVTNSWNPSWCLWRSDKRYLTCRLVTHAGLLFLLSNPWPASQCSEVSCGRLQSLEVSYHKLHTLNQFSTRSGKTEEQNNCFGGGLQRTWWL